jgi:formylglycine-generating enzyme required for sulfatase activity
MSGKRLDGSAVSWGDLLLFQGLPGADAQAAAAAQLLGLAPLTLPERSVRAKLGRRGQLPKPPVVGASVTRFRLPLRMPLGLVLEQSELKQQTTQALDLPAWDATEAADIEAMLDPSGLSAPAPTKRLDLSQTMARCLQALASIQPQGLDVERTVSALAQGRWPSPLPKHAQRRRLNQLHICVDLHPERQFLIHDYRAFLKVLSQARPGLRWTLHELDHPQAWQALASKLIQAGAHVPPVLFLCEMALLAEGERLVLLRVQNVLERLGTSLCQPMRWLDSALDVGEPLTGDAVTPELLSTLLACLSPAVTVEPELVRDMTLALGMGQNGLLLEQAVWTHAALDGALPFRQWHAAQQRQYQIQLKALPADLQATCWRVIARQHAYRHQVQRDQELLNWVSACGMHPAQDLPQEADCLAAVTRYARVAQHLLNLSRGSSSNGASAKPGAGVLQAAAQERLQTLPDFLDKHREVEDMLATVALQSFEPSLEEGEAGIDDLPAVHDVAVRLQGQSLCMAASSDSARPGVRLQDIEVSGDWVRVQDGSGARRTLSLSASGLARQPLVLHRWREAPAKELTVRGPAGALTVRTKERPHWAASLSQSDQGLRALIHWPNGKELWVDLSSQPKAHFDFLVQDWIVGFDAYAPVLIWTPKGLRAFPPLVSELAFRYLPSATFLMGSPEGVGADNESPQHPVTFTQGLWLAETPCTQALWQAVMGHNPSYFNKGPEAPQRPVECVSWDDAQQFLAKINSLLPEGCEAVLPTEAQWEYACRAGTHTAYWWGDEQDNSKANFYSRGETGVGDEGSTSPVDRYPPNPWGLRNMHGNVWEWCANGKERTYPPRDARDPMDDTGVFHPVVRGGSWVDLPDLSRSAYRIGAVRYARYRAQGFRFALRSSSNHGKEPQSDELKEVGRAVGGSSAGAGARRKATRAANKSNKGSP